MTESSASERHIRITIRVPPWLPEAVKQKAGAQGIPYTRYIRMLMERDVGAK